jgi:hypothetical protein
LLLASFWVFLAFSVEVAMERALNSHLYTNEHGIVDYDTRIEASTEAQYLAACWVLRQASPALQACLVVATTERRDDAKCTCLWRTRSWRQALRCLWSWCWAFATKTP